MAELVEKKTPLYEEHLANGGKIVPFAGYLLPVQYAGVIAEHRAVRERAGMFDVSHMGEFILRGPDAVENLQKLLTNDYRQMAIGRARYGILCYENGTTVDDLIVHKLADDAYFIVVNASNKDKDYAWMKEHLFGDATLTDISDETAQIALQGPLAAQIVASVAEGELPEKNYTFVPRMRIAGIECLVARTGYTGEDGFELYTSPAEVCDLWRKLKCAGEPFGMELCGLGARDTLRLEAAMPLYGHELSDAITPLESGLRFAVKLDTEGHDFIGREALLEEPKRARIGLRVTGRGIVREHVPLYLAGTDVQIGETTSGTHAPSFGYPIAMAIVGKEHAAVGEQFEADVRGKRVACEVVPLPFYKRAR